MQNLLSGDLIVGSTEGITEAMNPAEEEWSEEAMLEELKKITEKSAEEILHHIALPKLMNLPTAQNSTTI